MRHAEQINMTPNHLRCTVWKISFRFDTISGRIVDKVEAVDVPQMSKILQHIFHLNYVGCGLINSNKLRVSFN